MRRIIKDAAPAFWSNYCKKHSRAVYADLDKTARGKEIRSFIREYMLNEQKWVCCYCCKRIEIIDAHNEHIKPQTKFPNYTMDYNNLIVSCNDINTCGIKKDSEYDAMFVTPLEEDCEVHFRYLPNGVMEGLDERGEYTVKLLNLNSHRLVESRKAIYEACMLIAQTEDGKDLIYNSYIKEADGKLPDYANMVEYFMKRGAFEYITR